MYSQDLRTKALEAMQQAFPCERQFISEISVAMNSCKSNISPSNNPFFIRVAGQSGTGKTTQILPPIIEYLRFTKYVQLSVSKFAQFHPRYEEFCNIKKHYMRELTNGFALRAMFLLLEYCLQNHVNIVLDLALLEPAIEKYIFLLAKENGYKCTTHLMCMPKKLSDYFVNIRAAEQGRVVSKKSSWYLFSNMPKALKMLTTSGVFNDQDKLILWSNCRPEPLCVTIHSDKQCMNLLNKYRAVSNSNVLDLNEAKSKRRIWINNFMEQDYV